MASLAVVALIVSRRPDALFRAQFWAEDGNLWFAQNYNVGVLHALTRPVVGEFVTFPRLAAALSLAVPVERAPLVMNVLAIIVQALPPLFLLSPRLAKLGSLRARGVMALLLLSIPTSFEVHANVTNSMVFLALMAFLVCIAEPSKTAVGRIVDIATVVLSGATGPFAIFLTPVTAFVWLRKRQRWKFVLLCVVCCAAVVQTVTILHSAPHARSRAPLGATPTLFARIVGGQIVVSPIAGLTFLGNHPAAANTICIAALALAMIVVVYAILRAPFELRLFLMFCGLLLAAALWTPQAIDSGPQWPRLTLPGTGGRYWLLPVASLSWIYVWMTGRQRPVIVRAIGTLLTIAAFVVGTINWVYPPFQDLEFPRYARILAEAPPGKEVIIPINPPEWTMTLRKH